jgi:DNA-binding beta-propeller fold protein YncE
MHCTGRKNVAGWFIRKHQLLIAMHFFKGAIMTITMRPARSATSLFFEAKIFKAIVSTAIIFTLAHPGYLLAADKPVAATTAPAFQVDPFWPQPLPNHWVLGSAIGVGVDSRDHVFVIHRRNSFNERTEIGAATEPPTSECCIPAPNILEFDPQGNLVNAWGGPGEGYVWPASNHGLSLDPKDNIWIGGNGAKDSHILKFSRDGQFLQQIGTPGQDGDSNSMEHFGRVAKISFDAAANEAYVSDGYTNKRVAVLDTDTGAFKRYWGAYGNKPDDTNLGRYHPDDPLAQQFRNPVHCAEPSRDGLVYVCDRANDRIQVFKLDGTFVTEKRIAPKTLGDGSVWDIAFSRDKDQKYLYLADGKNMKVYILDRASLSILTSFGDGGRQPGQFFAVHSIATDSKGNIFTTETYEGKRVQKFSYRGLETVTTKDQGAPWGKARN